jgi:hypothetical protein
MMKLASMYVATLLILVALAFVVGATHGGDNTQVQAGDYYAGHRASDNRGSISTNRGLLTQEGYNVFFGPRSFTECRNQLKARSALTSTGAPW